MKLVLALTLTIEAITAIYRAIATWLERNLCRYAAAVADYFVHLTITTASATTLTALCAASGATAWLVLKAFLGIEILFRCGKYEFCAALTARQGFVFVHGKTS